MTKVSNFKNIKIKTPNSFDSDHQIVVATPHIQEQKPNKISSTKQLKISRCTPKAVQGHNCYLNIYVKPNQEQKG
jgi:hypothetical protein